MITAGKDRGRSGRVEKVLPQKDMVVIPGINEYKKHRKPMGQDRPGEIVTLVRPISASKVSIVCQKCKLVTRVGYRLEADKKIRVCRKCGNDLDSVVAVAKETKVKAKAKK